MAQVTLYLPDDVARLIRKEAKKARKSVSAFMADLARRKLSPDRWPEGFEALCGSWQGEFPEPEDLPTGPVEGLR